MTGEIGNIITVNCTEGLDRTDNNHITIKQGTEQDRLPVVKPKLPYDVARKKEFSKIDPQGMEAMREALLFIQDQLNITLPDAFNNYVSEVNSIKQNIKPE